ncbi:MAG: hypothetical protein JEZ00_10920 [Anaerolineaceae bacterium]|nr:hypothetical protein [Anaerolineaceae bacterium]
MGAKKILLWIVKSKNAQKLLEKLSIRSHYLMGIGSGGSVAYSGEKVAVDQMIKNAHRPYVFFDIGCNKGQYLKLFFRK